MFIFITLHVHVAFNLFGVLGESAAKMSWICVFGCTAAATSKTAPLCCSSSSSHKALHVGAEVLEQSQLRLMWQALLFTFLLNPYPKCDQCRHGELLGASAHSGFSKVHWVRALGAS